MNTYVEHKNRVKKLLTEIKGSLEPEPTSECCIYRVPKDLRRMNEAAYTPQLISIGPLHRSNKELAAMDNHKRRYVKSFLNRISAEKEYKILSFVQYNESRIRECYEESIQLETPEFTMMIVCDALFIIELFLRHSSRTIDAFLHQLTRRKYAFLDLQLLENQLPYFVLDELFKIADAEPRFIDLSNLFFFFRTPMFPKPPHNLEAVKHFTDLTRRALVESCPRVEGQGAIKDLPWAVKLNELGVKFKSIKGEGLLSIRLIERRNRLVPCLKVPELQIPCFTISDVTECELRNVMAWEQCYYPDDTRICNYVVLMDYLINTEKDVELLVGKEIISNHLGNNSEAANMFNKLGSGIIIVRGNSCYYNISKKLKTHCNSRWSKSIATLRRVYFKNPWRGTGTVAAVILLLLAVTQTICSVIQVKQGS